METSWKPSASRAERSAPIRPSIMSLGLTTSAPARAYSYGDFFFLVRKKLARLCHQTQWRDEMNLWNSLFAQLINCFIIHNYTWCRTQTRQGLAGEIKSLLEFSYDFTNIWCRRKKHKVTKIQTQASLCNIIQKTKLTSWLVVSWQLLHEREILKNKSSEKWF